MVLQVRLGLRRASMHGKWAAGSRGKWLRMRCATERRRSRRLRCRRIALCWLRVRLGSRSWRVPSCDWIHLSAGSRRRRVTIGSCRRRVGCVRRTVATTACSTWQILRHWDSRRCRLLWEEWCSARLRKSAWCGWLLSRNRRCRLLRWRCSSRRRLLGQELCLWR